MPFEARKVASRRPTQRWQYRTFLVLCVLLCNSAVAGEPEKAAAKILESLKFPEQAHPAVQCRHVTEHNEQHTKWEVVPPTFKEKMTSARIHQFESGKVGVISRHRLEIKQAAKGWEWCIAVWGNHSGWSAVRIEPFFEHWDEGIEIGDVSTESGLGIDINQPRMIPTEPIPKTPKTIFVDVWWVRVIENAPVAANRPGEKE